MEYEIFSIKASLLRDIADSLAYAIDDDMANLARNPSAPEWKEQAEQRLALLRAMSLIDPLIHETWAVSLFRIENWEPLPNCVFCGKQCDSIEKWHPECERRESAECEFVEAAPQMIVTSTVGDETGLVEWLNSVPNNVTMVPPSPEMVDEFLKSDMESNPCSAVKQ